MGRTRTTREKAELTGALAKNPQRYRGTPAKNETPLPEPPAHLSAAARDVWRELVDNSLPGVLTAADKFHVEQAAVLIAEFREIAERNKQVPAELKEWEEERDRLKNEKGLAESKVDIREAGRALRIHMKQRPKYEVFPTARIQLLTGNLLSKLGMNPTDRQRIQLPEGDGSQKEDGFESLH